MNFITIDTETTGLFPEKHGIVSIGYVLTDQNGERFDEGYTICNPGRVQYTKEAMDINGLAKKIIGAPRVTVALNELQDKFAHYKRMGELIAVMHNAPFDAGFISTSLRRHKCQYKDVNMFRRTLDTISVGFMAFGEVLSLDKLCQRLEVKNAEAHNALEDARATSVVFHKLKDYIQERVYG